MVLRALGSALGALALALAGCGGEEPTRPERAPRAVLVLDFAPNAVHAGTYLATARGEDHEEGVDLEVRAPSSSGDALRLLRAGRADVAFLDIHDLALADERRGGLVGAMALVQRPLAAVLARPDVRRPRDLEGRRVGISGLPSDEAVLASIVRGDGGDPDLVEVVRIGFQVVPALLGGRVAGATAFWNAEGVALRARRPRTREFRVDEYGAPPYPELVLAATRRTVRERPGLVRAVVRALRRGYEATLEDPDAALDALAAGAPGVDRTTAARELEAVAGSFLPPGGGRFGELDVQRLERWAVWEARFGIVERPPEVERLFTTAFAPPTRG